MCESTVVLLAPQLSHHPGKLLKIPENCPQCPGKNLKVFGMYVVSRPKIFGEGSRVRVMRENVASILKQRQLVTL